MRSRRWFALGWLVVMAAVAGIAAYFGYHAGVAAAATSGSASGQVVIAPGYYGFGFFGFLPLLLLIILLFAVFARRPRWGGWRGRYGPGYWGPGPWSGSEHGLPPAFEAWHKRAHGETAPAGRPQDTTQSNL